jgi:hypothetical protein
MPSPDAGPPQPGSNDGGGEAGPSTMGDCTPAAPGSIFCDPFVKMPKSIKALGIYPAAPDLNQHPASMREYVPDPPLWSDGLEKQRFLILPQGKKIDNKDNAKWVFPFGTVFVKTFLDDGGPGGKPRAIETRIVRSAKPDAVFPFEFYVYQWAPDGTDATLVVNDQDGIGGDINKDAQTSITIKHMVDGYPVNKGQPFMHTIPSFQNCGECHTENSMVTGTAVIGFDELRLNNNVLNPASPKTQLQQFFEAGLFTSPLSATPPTIKDPDQRLLSIKRFIFGNCVHCHNGNSVFDLHPDNFVKNTVNKKTEAQSVVPPPGWLRVIPGKPDQSVLFVQVQRVPLPAPVGGDTMNRLRAMPPAGVADVAADLKAVADIKAWIMSLPAK